MSNLFILPERRQQLPKCESPGRERRKHRHFQWTPDSNLLTSDFTRLVQTDVQGKNPTVLASDPSAGMLALTTCGSQYIVFPWAFHGGTNAIGLWRLNADGSHPTQLTDGSDDFFGSAATCAANHDWVYFFRDVEHIWRVPLNASGKAEPVLATAVPHSFQAARGMGLSPDTKTLAYMVELVNLEGENGTPKLALLDLDRYKPAAPARSQSAHRSRPAFHQRRQGASPTRFA